MILRRRAWLLVLGLIVGLLVGYFVSKSQEPTYETSTKLLVSNALEGKSSDFAGLTNPQLVLTYVQMLKTKDLRDKAAAKAGLPIDANSLTIQQVAETQVIEIKVTGNNAENVAIIANTMAATLLDEIEAVRSEQFSTAEATLTQQIDQAQAKIDELKKQYDQTSKQVYQSQLTEVEKQIAKIQSQISALQIDIVKLTAAPTIEHRAEVAQKEAEVAQLQSTFKLYDELRTNLLVLGKPSQSTKPEDDPQLQQLDATIALYQKIHNELLSTLEETRLAQARHTPNALQIQVAFAPESPIRPVPVEYTLLSGVAGFLLAMGLVTLLEVSREGESVAKRPRLAETKA
jgi:uncharacterized protein involved in exopolysaccharide biosynthesis